MSGRARGRWGEDRAAAWYEAAGFHILARNWRSPVRQFPGELDLVVRRDDTVVFVEVKARRSGDLGSAALAVDATKQRKVRRLAELWLIDNGIDLAAIGVRFDVVAVDAATVTVFDAAF